MARTEHQKLVRDRIEEIITANGDVAHVRTLASDREYEAALRTKIIEEATELSESSTREAFLREYADLMIVLDAVTNLLEFSEAEIKTAIALSLERKGGFEKRHFLEWTDSKS